MHMPLRNLRAYAAFFLRINKGEEIPQMLVQLKSFASIRASKRLERFLYLHLPSWAVERFCR
jgi:hypothetical protein